LRWGGVQGAAGLADGGALHDSLGTVLGKTVTLLEDLHKRGTG